MSKRRRTVVPDFSSKKPAKGPVPATGAAAPAPPPVAAPRVKPQATSSKSGRRGG